MRVLWLDDLRDPADPKIINAFGTDPATHTWVKTPQEAVDELLSQTWDMVSFDNDLGLDLPPAPEEHPAHRMTEGRHVAAFVEEGAYFGTLPRMKLKVHSANPPAGEAITATIRKAYQYWGN